MTILVTGAAGFIGFHTSRLLLEKNYKVIGVDNINSYYDIKIKKDRLKILKNYKNFNFLKIDISNFNSLKNKLNKYKIDYIINLAAQAGVRYSLKNPKAYFDSNLKGFFNILELSRFFKVKHLIYASTSSVYGNNSKLPFKECNIADHPIQFYAATKRANELMAHSYSYLYNLPTTGLRFFTVYGPWGRPDMALFIFTKNILNNKKIELFNYGNHIRDFTYIDDIINPILKLIKKIPQKKNKKKNIQDPSESTSPYKIFNIGNNNPKKLTDFLNEIEKQIGKKAKIKLKKLQIGDVYETFADTSKLEKYVNYKSKTSIKKGIFSFISWYRSYYNK